MSRLVLATDEEIAERIVTLRRIARNTFAMDNSDFWEIGQAAGDIETLQSDLSSAREEIAELRKAAEPFAYMSVIISNNLRHQLRDDAVIFSEEGDSQAWLTIGHFRRLVSALRSRRTKDAAS